jgi:hypothetical protein
MKSSSISPSSTSFFIPTAPPTFPARTSAFSTQASIEQLFSLSITRLDVRQGRMLWDDQPFPSISPPATFRCRWIIPISTSRYNGRLLLGMVDTKLPDCRPFAWMSSVDFSLASDSATFSSLKWNSGHSNLSASGQVTNFRRPHLQAAYDAHIDLTEAASVARRRELRSRFPRTQGRRQLVARPVRLQWPAHPSRSRLAVGSGFFLQGISHYRLLDQRSAAQTVQGCKARFSAEASPAMPKSISGSPPSSTSRPRLEKS